MSEINGTYFQRQEACRSSRSISSERSACNGQRPLGIETEPNPSLRSNAS